jgi:hypothetical protein
VQLSLDRDDFRRVREQPATHDITAGRKSTKHLSALESTDGPFRSSEPREEPVRQQCRGRTRRTKELGDDPALKAGDAAVALRREPLATDGDKVRDDRPNLKAPKQLRTRLEPQDLEEPSRQDTAQVGLECERHGTPEA